MKFKSLIVALLVVLVAPAFALAFDNGHDDPDQLQVGFVVVTPGTNNTDGLVVFETFGELKGNTATQAGVLPSGMTTSALLFVSTNGRLSRNLGVAIANPDPLVDATVTLSLFHSDGTPFAAEPPITVKAHSQTAQFVTQVFADQSAQLADFTGTLAVTSNIPVAVVGLRFRGDNFSTIPITNLVPGAMPVISPGVGGPKSVILPQFALGGGWASQLIIANTGSAALNVRVDIFKQDGSALAATLNGTTNSTFSNLAIPPKGVIVLSARDQNGDDDF